MCLRNGPVSRNFWSGDACRRYFPTLAVGLLDFKVDVVLARLEADFSDQPPSIPAVPNYQVSLQCPINEYPCSASWPNRKVLLQCLTTKYPCSAQARSIPAVHNRRVSLQCRTAEYPCSAQPQSIPAVPNRRVCRAQPKSIPAVPKREYF